MTMKKRANNVVELKMSESPFVCAFIFLIWTPANLVLSEFLAGANTRVGGLCIRRLVFLPGIHGAV